MHWYVLSKTTGLATLCASEQNARDEADIHDRLYPHAAPHVATQLVPVDAQELIEANVADAIREYRRRLG